MNRNNFLKLGLVACMALAITGCAFLTKHIGTISAATKRITYQGTLAALHADPALRSKFVLAEANLSSALASGTIDSTLLIQITQTIPSKRLAGDIGSISIEVGALILDLSAGDKLDLSQAPNVVAIATAMRDGIRAALMETP